MLQKFSSKKNRARRSTLSKLISNTKKVLNLINLLYFERYLVNLY